MRRLEAWDLVTDAATDARAGASARAVRFREQTRFVSVSLPLAGAWRSDPEHRPSDLFLITMQYNCGLYLSAMYEANVVLEAHGCTADWLGDAAHTVPLAAGARNTRHNTLVSAWVAAVREALPTPVTQCLKGAKHDIVARAAAAAAAADLNVGHIPDWGARGAAKSGRHLVGENKCYTPLVPFSPGAGSRGGIGMVGATRALGNTEEAIVRDNYGLAARGVGETRPFDHATGAGRVSAHTGLYHDCIQKGNTLLLLVSEVSGGVNGRSVRFLTRLAHQARSQSDTVHLDRAGRAVSFFTHHARAISSAAAFGHGAVLLAAAKDACVRAGAVRVPAAVAAARGAVAAAAAAAAANGLGARVSAPSTCGAAASCSASPALVPVVCVGSGA